MELTNKVTPKRMQCDIWGKVRAMPNLPRTCLLITAMKTTYWLIICRDAAQVSEHKLP